MGENHFDPRPVTLYGVVMMMSGVAYYILSNTIIRHHGADSALRAAVGKDVKGVLSVAMYATAIAVSFANHWIALATYVAVALMWLIPDRRIERRAHR
jgi:uncharacterized membrane protein